MQQQQFGRRSCSTDAQAESLVPRSCALFQGVDEAGPGAFSIFFATAVMNEQQLPEDCDPSCESSAVDCTLSLATPSTRGYQSSPTSKPSPLPAVIQQRHAGYPLRFDFLRTNQEPKQIPPVAAGTGGTTVLKVSGDPVPLPRRCASCDTTSTPLWRNGPRGPKSLCNACGIRYKKEERRAASSAAAHSSTSSSSSSSSASSAAAHLEAPASQQQLHPTMGYGGYHHRWGCPGSRLAEARKCPPSPILSAVTLGDNVDAMEGAALPYVPWHRFNVAVPPQGAEFATSRFHDCSLH